MAKKSRKPSKRQTKASKRGLTKRKPTLMDKLPKTHEEYLELLIFFTERVINPAYPDKGMVAQAERLKKELADYKASKKT